MLNVVVVTAVFAVVYFFIVTERVHRTTIALAGALVVLLLPGLSLTQAEAVGFIDFNTLGLLTGMMLIVAILRRTGVFRFLALSVAQASKGNVFVVFAGLGAITALTSAFIDNVTTVLMFVPVIYLICDLLGRSVVPFLTMEIMMANIGGMATLIGDPPNILVGSRAVLPPAGAHLSFVDFLMNLGPLALVCFALALTYLRLRARRGYFKPERGEKMKTLASLDAAQAIKDRPLLSRALTVMALVLAGFVFHHRLGLEPATIALSGAAILLIVTRINPEEVLREVEWGVLFFFIGLFVLVGALEKVGVVAYLADSLLGVFDNPCILLLLLLWVTAGAASLLSAVPAVTVLIPLVQVLADHFGAGAPEVSRAFWWALASGACLGGNATVVGAAANMAVVGMSEKEREPLGFASYARLGIPVTGICLAVASVYILLRYL